MDGGWEDVICGLAHVHVIVRMNELLVSTFSPEKLDSTICNHFVSIHVGRGAATRLEDVNHKLLIHTAIHYFLSSRNNSFAFFRVQQIALHIRCTSCQCYQ